MSEFQKTVRLESERLVIRATVRLPDEHDGYFALSYGSWLNGREYMFGQCREFDRHFPQFADVRALHLADVNGAPMHAESNGWYWLTGALGGLGERFHGGNGESYARKAPHECAAILAEHLRITSEQCWALLKLVSCVSPSQRRTVWRDIVNGYRGTWREQGERMTLRQLQALIAHWEARGGDLDDHVFVLTNTNASVGLVPLTKDEVEGWAGRFAPSLDQGTLCYLPRLS
jgi:hypothetical protein